MAIFFTSGLETAPIISELNVKTAQTYTCASDSARRSRRQIVGFNLRYWASALLVDSRPILSIDFSKKMFMHEAMEG
jgi:hypothetical protein